MGSKDKNTSCNLVGFPNGSSTGSTVYYGGETRRFTLHLNHLDRHAGTPNKAEAKVHAE